MKAMLKTVENFSQKYRYEINATKSPCLPLNSGSNIESSVLLLNGQNIPVESSTTHPGLNRSTKGCVNIEEKITCGRKTAYSLLGAGLHGKTGLKQDVKAHIWSTFVVPRIIYGIEALPFSESDLKKLDSFQVKSLKQIQYLPDRTPNVAALALLGIPPLSINVHKNSLNLLYRILTNPNSLEYSIAKRQLAVKKLEDKSFFSRSRLLLAVYNLPTAYDILNKQWNCRKWKRMVQEAITSYTESLWANEIRQKTSLKFINPRSVKVGQVHHLYSTVNCNLRDIQRAETKARLLKGTYTLQANRAAFNQYTVDPTCRICNLNPETREHFISNCIYYEDIRDSYKQKIKRVLESLVGLNTEDVLNNPLSFTHLILDCTHPNVGQYLSNPVLVQQLERYPENIFGRSTVCGLKNWPNAPFLI